jgi:hypothetical protein
MMRLPTATRVTFLDVTKVVREISGARAGSVCERERDVWPSLPRLRHAFVIVLYREQVAHTPSYRHVLVVTHHQVVVQFSHVELL